MTTKESKKILIADDSVFFRTKLSDILTEAGHTVKFAENGTEAINEVKANAGQIDLLVLDLQMPEVDGFGVLEWMQESGDRGKFPVLAMTDAYEATLVLNKLKDLGASGFLSKDMSSEQIIFRVNQFLFP